MSQAIQEVDQIGLLLIGEANFEALIVEVDRILSAWPRSRCGNTAPAPPDRAGSVLSAYRCLGAVAADHRAAWVGHWDETFGRQAGLAVHFSVNTGRPEMSSAGGALAPASAMPMFNGALTEWSPTLGVS